MLFATKPKGYFVARNADQVLLARTSNPTESPVTIEALRSCAADDAAAMAAALGELQPKKAPSGYLHAVCGVHPERQVIRRATLELKRVKEPGYLEEACATQLRIEPKDYVLAVLNANDGSDYDVAKATGKEVTVCGLRHDDIATTQEALLAAGIYPERLELGAVAAIGALTDVLTFAHSKSPTLLLEFGAEMTNSFIVSANGLEAARPIGSGLQSMVPIVQKELGLKDEEAAAKLFYSGAFDFSGLGPALIKKLLKELQASIGFYEVQTGQSVGQLVCTQLPPVLAWLQDAVANALGVTVLTVEFEPWLQSRRIVLPETLRATVTDTRWLGLFGLMARFEGAHAENSPAKA
ncbi:DUF1727 domain-containing protein [Horticoccus luteus]|uniref:DUF1727 domain-containing protein n=1 Tax=Horticoccus luteus TaxID=2862869 RepID=A0A8F9TXI1_9BACT|nr:DUF1727 domain-containing protein [Horticoccus luteus]QYM79563.1 DUF1727 domain-containing protein [Horticoccus luteus]